jgi:hypothetical protein
VLVWKGFLLPKRLGEQKTSMLKFGFTFSKRKNNFSVLWEVFLGDIEEVPETSHASLTAMGSIVL